MGAADAIAFPVLAGSAVTQFFGFGYAQLGEIVTGWREKRAGKSRPIEILPIPEELAPVAEPLVIREEVLSVRFAELEALQERLRGYRGQELDGGDPALRQALADLRSALEEVFEAELSFRGEYRAKAAVYVNQNVEDLHGRAIAMRIGSAGAAADAQVEQRIGTVHEGGEATGLQIDRLG